jgi:hypothetical protein
MPPAALHGNGYSKAANVAKVASIGVLWLSSLVAAVWAVSADRQSLFDCGEARDQTLADHEQRLRLTERQLTEIRADVKWIRHALESHDGR